MSYFIVQVQTNYEKYVLSNLAELLLKKKVNIVQSIYALATKIDFQNSIDQENIRDYLKQTRVRAYLNNVRYAYYQLNSNDINLKEVYKKQIRELTKEANKFPTSRNKNDNPFIRGYIIIKLKGDFQRIPSDLYHDIKSIPKVISIPNKYNVPEHEIEYYFRQIEERKNHAN